VAKGMIFWKSFLADRQAFDNKETKNAKNGDKQYTERVKSKLKLNTAILYDL